MVKFISIAFLCLTLVACGGKRTVTVYQDVFVGVPVVPEPPTLIKPILEITLLTEEEKSNRVLVAKAYVISLHQLKNYSDLQQRILDKYDELAKLTGDDLDNKQKSVKLSLTPPLKMSANNETNIAPTINNKNELFDFKKEYQTKKLLGEIKDLHDEAEQLESNNYKKE